MISVIADRIFAAFVIWAILAIKYVIPSEKGVDI